MPSQYNLKVNGKAYTVEVEPNIPLFAVPAAVSNAVFDAAGIRLRSVPFTPEKVKAALQAKAGAWQARAEGTKRKYTQGRLSSAAGSFF